MAFTKMENTKVTEVNHNFCFDPVRFEMPVSEPHPGDNTLNKNKQATAAATKH